jgi:integrase
MLALIRAILRRAERQWRWIERAPAVTLAPEPRHRIRWLTHDEADLLLYELPEHLEKMARFTLATGLRAANVCFLEWSQVDLERRMAWIHPDQAKARRAIAVPLNTDAMIVLRRCQGQHPTRVFTFRGEPIAEANGPAWYKALKRTGIEHFRWHDLRHTWASWHVQSGTPLHVLQELGGWSSAAMVQRYAHLSAAHLAEYATAIETRPHTIRHTTKKAVI